MDRGGACVLAVNLLGAERSIHMSEKQRLVTWLLPAGELGTYAACQVLSPTAFVRGGEDIWRKWGRHAIDDPTTLRH